MVSWTWPAWVGVIGGLALFAGLFLPAVVWQSRRFGRLSALRLFGTAALAVYGVALIAYTLLPLPSGDLALWCAQHGVDGAQLRPFQFLADIRRETAGMSLVAAAKSIVVLQVVFNVLLFLPWGIFARGFAGWGVVRSTVTAALASLLIEGTQYTGVFGLIGCSYRIGDVDDLMTNTLGGLLGALVAPLVMRWMPRPADLRRGRGTPRPVTTLRRWLGMLVDVVSVLLLGTALGIGWALIGYLAGDRTLTAPDLATTWFPAAVLLWLPPLIGSGASLGQRAMWLEPRWRSATGELVHGTLPRRLLRGACGAAGWGVLGVLDGWGLVLVLFVITTVVAVPFSRGHRGLSYAVSGAELVDARTPLRAGAPDAMPAVAR
ncbi:VanZ family protein [Cellulomonas sp. RIT-PI-Y]|uniref:VanZ family protein n=1 Tax=Cellulomonas sp. RIT-PI-Y TaxID=3035297 RepID=UPI0021DA6586|nr:VanZ family protein [Cellulomonas sp. RIT-PI-Y]